MAGFWLRDTMVHRPNSLIAPIPMAVQELTELPLEDVFELFMRRLTPLLTRLATGLGSREQAFTALIYLVSDVRNSLSMPESPWLYMTRTTE